MKNLLGVLGCAAAAAVSGTVVYFYLNDAEVRTKVNAAVESVRDAATEITSRIARLRGTATVTYEEADVQNRAWVDQQWEALGI